MMMPKGNNRESTQAGLNWLPTPEPTIPSAKGKGQGEGGPDALPIGQVPIPWGSLPALPPPPPPALPYVFSEVRIQRDVPPVPSDESAGPRGGASASRRCHPALRIA